MIEIGNIFKLGTKYSVPLDANYNPDGAYINETRIALTAGHERPLSSGAQWGSTASFTHSGVSMFRGFLTDISNAQNNASGFRENIEQNDLYADSHIVWPARSNVRFLTGADFLFSNGEAEGATFNYRPAAPEMMDKARRIAAMCARHDVDLRAAALQFVLAHPAIVSVIPGARSIAEVEENVALIERPIPTELWADLKEAGLLDPAAPTPGSPT